MRRPLLVIDGDSFAHRAYHALPKTIRRSPRWAISVQIDRAYKTKRLLTVAAHKVAIPFLALLAETDGV
jgi:5'-3' exonuclease